MIPIDILSKVWTAKFDYYIMYWKKNYHYERIFDEKKKVLKNIDTNFYFLLLLTIYIEIDAKTTLKLCP